jgi:hypothetical protein
MRGCGQQAFSKCEEKALRFASRWTKARRPSSGLNCASRKMVAKARKPIPLSRPIEDLSSPAKRSAIVSSRQRRQAQRPGSSRAAGSACLCHQRRQGGTGAAGGGASEQGRTYPRTAGTRRGVASHSLGVAGAGFVNPAADAPPRPVSDRRFPLLGRERPVVCRTRLVLDAPQPGPTPLFAMHEGAKCALN